MTPLGCRPGILLKTDGQPDIAVLAFLGETLYSCLVGRTPVNSGKGRIMT